MLESIKPGCLKRDVYRHEQEKSAARFAGVSNGCRITKTRRCPIVRLTKTPKKNLRIEKESPGKSQKEVQSVANFNPFADPEVRK